MNRTTPPRRSTRPSWSRRRALGPPSARSSRCSPTRACPAASTPTGAADYFHTPEAVTAKWTRAVDPTQVGRALHRHRRRSPSRPKGRGHVTSARAKSGTAMTIASGGTGKGRRSRGPASAKTPKVPCSSDLPRRPERSAECDPRERRAEADPRDSGPCELIDRQRRAGETHHDVDRLRDRVAECVDQTRRKLHQLGSSGRRRQAAFDQFGQGFARAHRRRYSLRHGVPPCWRRRQPVPVDEPSARMHPYPNFQQV